MTYGPTRSNSVYIPNDVHWLLRKAVKRLNTAESVDTYSVDGLATDVLRQWIKENHPELIKLRERRDAIDQEADTTAAKQTKGKE